MADNPLREGWGYDYATGKPVDLRKPEEQVRQAYERTLVEEYGYAREQLDIEVHIQRGSRKPDEKVDTDRADIVIYRTATRSKRDQHSDILGVVETKRSLRKEGVRQLMSYMSASSCDWGVWTNQEEIEYLYHDKTSGEVRRDYIFQIPRKGETALTYLTHLLGSGRISAC